MYRFLIIVIEIALILWMATLVVISLGVGVSVRPLYLYFFQPDGSPIKHEAIGFLSALLLLGAYHTYKSKKKEAEKRNLMKSAAKRNLVTEDTTQSTSSKSRLESTAVSKAVLSTRKYYNKKLGINGKYFVYRMAIMEVLEIALQLGSVTTLASSIASTT